MTVLYFIVLGTIVIIGFVGMCIFITGDPTIDDRPITFLRVVALFTMASWVVAILWPVLLVLVVPALMVYGVVVAFKAYKTKTLDY